MNKINTLFVVTEMRLGGREKVTKNIAEELNRHVETEIFSIWRKKSFFDADVKISYGDNISVANLRIKVRQSKYIDSLKKKYIIPTVKKILPYSLMQLKRLQALSKYIKNHGVKNVVLTDLTISFANFLRREHPTINIIAWVHMDCQHFFNVQYEHYNKELLRGFSVVDRIVTLTDNQAKDFAAITKKMVVSIPNPMPNISELKTNFKSKNIVIVSRIDIFHKGLDMLLDTVKLIAKDWEVHIAGEAQTLGEYKEFEKMIQDAGLSNRIQLYGALQGEALDKFYSTGSIFLMTSRYEGFPLTLGEAMSHGLPVVSFNMDGVRKITEDGKYGILVDMGNIQEMAAQINQLINNYKAMKYYGAKSLDRVSEYSVAKVIKLWADILK